MPRVTSMLWLLPLAILTSCSTFDQKWDSMAIPVAANPAALLAGRWEGTWQSDSTDQWGHMQALIRPTTVTVKDEQIIQQYEAEIRLRYFEVGFTEYRLTLNAKTLPDGRLQFDGRRDHGHFQGGIMRYSGLVYPTEDKFYCDYISEKDAGTFKMRRIVQELQ